MQTTLEAGPDDHPLRRTQSTGLAMAHHHAVCADWHERQLDAHHISVTVPLAVVPAPGHFKNRFGAVYPCHAGTFKPAKGVGSCSRCKGRTYASKAGQKTCSQVCPAERRVNAAHTACIS
jgi:hypothetical protein